MMDELSPLAVKRAFSGCYDFELRRLDIGGRGKMYGYISFIDGLVSGEAVAREVIEPITDRSRMTDHGDPIKAAQMLMDGVVYSYTPRFRKTLDEVTGDMLCGFCAVFIDGFSGCITFEVKSPDKRSIDMPKEEKVVKGSKDAFVEIIKTNTMQVRRKLKDTALKIEEVKLKASPTPTVTVVYMEDIADMDIVSAVKSRLEKIEAVGILTSADIENGLCDNIKSPFPQLITTERPDKFCMNILEGRVGILVDGLPIGYLTPVTFSQFFKVPEDKASHFIVASCLTALRYISFIIALILPAFYVAVAMYHQEMIPTRLMQSIIVSKQSVPFPTAVEVLTMLLSFELLQEAGLRLPNPIGETVSIIGALIVGQSAVEAKVVSPVVIIVVAMAGIAGYTMPNQDMGAAVRVCRFLFVIAAALFGMPGLSLLGCVLIRHLCSLESFGVPYMAPFSEGRSNNIFRALFQPPESGSKPDPVIYGNENDKKS